MLKEGTGVSKLEDFGSDRQPDPLDLDADDEGPWQIKWDVGPNHASNRLITDHWVREVMASREVSIVTPILLVSAMGHLSMLWTDVASAQTEEDN